MFLDIPRRKDVKTGFLRGGKVRSQQPGGKPEPTEQGNCNLWPHRGLMSRFKVFSHWFSVILLCFPSTFYELCLDSLYNQCGENTVWERGNVLKFWSKTDLTESWNSSRSWHGIRIHQREVKTSCPAVNNPHPPHSRNSQAPGKEGIGLLTLCEIGAWGSFI